MSREASRLMIAAAGLMALTVVGTIGYRLLEQLPFLDALYLTVMTISTVGYGDLVPHTPAGRVFTIALVASGAGTALYLLSAIAEMLLAGRLREALGESAMTREIQRLEGHVIICGFGRFGRSVIDELLRNDRRLVVVDRNLELRPHIERLGVPYLIDNALSDEVLERAGVAKARAIVVATASDSDNVFITLSARERSASIRIHARAETESGIRRLKLAGADQVISAYQSGGKRMAQSILRPAVVDFLEISTGPDDDVALEEIRIGEGSPLVGRSLETVEREHDRVRVVAIQRGEERLRVIPPKETDIAAGDYLVVVGDAEVLGRFAQLAQRG